MNFGFFDSTYDVMKFQACAVTPGSCCPGYPQIQGFVCLDTDELYPIHSPVKIKLLGMRDNFLQMCELLCLVRQCKLNLIGSNGEGGRGAWEREGGRRKLKFGWVLGKGREDRPGKSYRMD